MALHIPAFFDLSSVILCLFISFIIEKGREKIPLPVHSHRSLDRMNYLSCTSPPPLPFLLFSCPFGYRNSINTEKQNKPRNELVGLELLNKAPVTDRLGRLGSRVAAHHHGVRKNGAAKVELERFARSVAAEAQPPNAGRKKGTSFADELRDDLIARDDAS